MTITINGNGPIVGSDRAEAGVNDDITSLAAVSSVNGGQLAGMRNKIINGKMDVSQRGGSFNVTLAGTYTLDRYALYIGGGGACNVSQSGDVPTTEFLQSLRVSVTTADVALGASDNYTISQRIEGYNVRDLTGRPFTLSFWVRSAKVGTHCVAFRGAQAMRSFITEYTIAAANTWEFKKITVSPGLITDGAWEWTNGVGLLVDWIMASGTGFNTSPNAWQTGNLLSTSNQVNVFDTVGNLFGITGVQLEVGSVATHFEHRPYGMELALCQRYYETGKLFACCDGAMAYVAASTAFQIQKRTTPTFIVRDNAGNPGFCSVDAGSLVPASVGGNETYVFTHVNNSVRPLNNFANFNWVASAEL